MMNGLFSFSFLASLTVSSWLLCSTKSDAAPPSQEECIECDDIATPWMLTNGYTCETAPNWLFNNRCNQSPNWNKNRYCSKSCYDWGYSYFGGSQHCCPGCSVCDDIPSPQMTPAIGYTCGHVTNWEANGATSWLLNRCRNKNEHWWRNKFCKSACARLGFGYPGINCCPFTPPEESESLRSEWIALIQSRSPSTMFDDPTSAQYLAFDWLVKEFLSRTTTPSLEYDDDEVTQRFAAATVLLAFKADTAKEDLLRSSYWASFPIETLSIPRSWKFYLYPPVGSIPKEIGLLTSITSLDFGYYVAPEGTLPTEFGLLTSLTYLNLQISDNSGTFPSEFWLLTNLATLKFYNSGSAETIPAAIGLLTSLTDLSLSGMAGTIPSEIGLLTSLAGSLSLTGMTGSIPSEVGLLTHLEYVELYGSYFYATSRLSGSIPTEFGLLTKLEGLIVEQNALTGTIPTEFGLMTGSRDFYFSHNDLRGTLPSEIGLQTMLEQLFLVDNPLLAGPVPSELGNLVNLEILHIYNTSLTGSIPSDLCDDVGSKQQWWTAINCYEIECNCCHAADDVGCKAFPGEYWCYETPCDVLLQGIPP
mmetsp:Transcript_19266/g.28518  ORF Transcript_19266/g.28518 Transcript_19266/m.28518 type:complete len:588 (-) Transcript_19266:176-1939(-)